LAEEKINICVSMANYQKFSSLEGGGKIRNRALVKSSIRKLKKKVYRLRWQLFFIAPMGVGWKVVKKDGFDIITSWRPPLDECSTDPKLDRALQLPRD
jgi:hypothetical protein